MIRRKMLKDNHRSAILVVNFFLDADFPHSGNLLRLDMQAVTKLRISRHHVTENEECR
jgi:hypothetical protein